MGKVCLIVMSTISYYVIQSLGISDLIILVMFMLVGVRRIFESVYLFVYLFSVCLFAQSITQK